jgi:hypothetical protein
MRTKTLLCAAVLAAGVASSMAQSNVYSLNVVGYVNVATTGGGSFALVANPLNNANNSITNLFSTAQDGDQIYRWNNTIQDVDGTVFTYSSFLHKWDGNFTLKPGEGIFYLNAGNNATQTFVGDVIQGSYTNPVPFGANVVVGAGSFNVYGSPVPIGGSFTNATVGITPQDGDQVYTWNQGIQDVDGTVATYSQFLGKWDTTAPTVAPGIAFFYLGAGNNQAQWVRNFTVQ